MHNAVPTGAGAGGRGVPNCKGFLGNDVLPKRSKPTLSGQILLISLSWLNKRCYSITLSRFVLHTELGNFELIRTKFLKKTFGDTNGPGGVTSGNSWWGCAARFS